MTWQSEFFNFKQRDQAADKVNERRVGRARCSVSIVAYLCHTR